MNRLFERPIAHRGLHDRSRGIIENSRSAFAAAIAHGYAIECDVQLSSDGIPFIFHDDTFDRLTGARGPSTARPIAEVQALVLTGSADGDTPQRLDELLAQVDGRVLLQIELKRQASAQHNRTLAERVAAALRAYDGPIVLESFDPYILMALRRTKIAVPIGIITQAYATSDDGLSPARRFALRHLLHWPFTRFDFVSCNADDLALPAIRWCRARGMEVTAWTIRSPAAASAALAAADQIVFEGYLPAIG